MASACVASALDFHLQIQFFKGTDKVWNSYRLLIAGYARQIHLPHIENALRIFYRIVEVNVAIMVSCMPACAILFKKFWPKNKNTPSLRAWISKSGRSTSDASPQDTEVQISVKNLTPRDEYENDIGNRRFWRLRDGLRRGEHPAVIIYHMEESRILNGKDASISEKDALGYVSESLEPE